MWRDREQSISSTGLDQAGSIWERTRSIVQRTECTWTLWEMARGLSGWRRMSGGGIIFDNSEDILDFDSVSNENRYTAQWIQPLLPGMLQLIEILTCRKGASTQFYCITLNFKLPTAVCVWQGGEAGRLITLAGITSFCSAPADQEGRGPGRDSWATSTHCMAVSKQGS